MIQQLRLTALVAALVVAAMAPSAWSQSSQQSTRTAPSQATLPELRLPAIDPRLLPRPPDVIRTVYRFAAEHPEVLRYMPCFCGCNEMGHRSSEDCFVKSRSKGGVVTEWNEHGIACAMCIAVAERAKTMCDAGASLSDVRADIEKRYGHTTGLRTNTPLPPKK
jgi:hypothetical protein